MAHLRDTAQAGRQRHPRHWLKIRMAPTEQQRKANLRLGLILAAVAVMFGVAFVARMVWLR